MTSAAYGTSARPRKAAAVAPEPAGVSAAAPPLSGVTQGFVDDGTHALRTAFVSVPGVEAVPRFAVEVTVRVVELGVLATVHAALYPAGAAPEMVADCPTLRPCGSALVTVKIDAVDVIDVIAYEPLRGAG